MRRPSIVLLAVLAAAVSACTAGESQYSDISDYTETPSEFHIHAFGRAGEVRQEDRYFIFRAGVGNLYDIATAEMAEEKSRNPAIQDFARRVLVDASERQRRLAMLAEQHVGIEAPARLDRTLAARRDRLAGLGGAAFDSAYLRDRVEISEQAIAVYREEARGGSEALLTGFAGEILSELEREKRIATGLVGTASR
jgi:putative membrane protein